MMKLALFALFSLLLADLPWSGASAPGSETWVVTVRTTGGQDLVGTLEGAALLVVVDGEERQVALEDLLSLHSAAPASEFEATRISEHFDLLSDEDLKKAELAAAVLADIGLPLITPLLQSYTDDDTRHPDLRYRLYARILPGHADRLDRSHGLIRLAGGEALRGDLASGRLRLHPSAGGSDAGDVVELAADEVRRIAVRRPRITRAFELDSIRDCTYLGALDAGIVVTPASSLVADAEGLARLSFDEDGWVSDPDGIHDPLLGKRRLQEGFRWGSVLGRVGPTGERWFVGKHVEKDDLGEGRLYFVINENERWTNNVGSYRVRLTVQDAYDVGEAR